MSFRQELLFQCHIVFNDSVMDDDKMIFAVAVGMSISVTGLSVSSPAGMPDADMAADRIGFQCFFQIDKASLLLRNTDFSIFVNCDTRRIIASVFETSKTVNQKIRGFSAAHITYNTAHKWYSSLSISYSCIFLFL